ncbi:hypothetical protein [Neisseria sp. Ec49-e6-T10]|uniref:hypothetical protein n=1 Tax=Neisseria sp. Ec49-e6-T10 TaxID=3140744 RepID=UPI003EBAF030
MAESSYYYFNCFTANLGKPAEELDFHGFGPPTIDQYFYDAEFFMIPHAVLNKVKIVYIVKFPKDKRSEELITKAQQLGLSVCRVYFSKKNYDSWLNTPKGKEDGSYKRWMESVASKILLDDQTYYPYKQEEGLFH